MLKILNFSNVSYKIKESFVDSKCVTVPLLNKNFIPFYCQEEGSKVCEVHKPVKYEARELPTTHFAGKILVFYLHISLFYYLAKFIIFTRSSRIPCIFFLEGGIQGHLLRERNFTLSYVVSEIWFFEWSPPLFVMGEALGIHYNQTFFVRAWNIYLSDDCSLLLICYAWHVPATTEMISFLLAGKII